MEKVTVYVCLLGCACYSLSLNATEGEKTISPLAAAMSGVTEAMAFNHRPNGVSAGMVKNAVAISTAARALVENLKCINLENEAINFTELNWVLVHLKEAITILNSGAIDEKAATQALYDLAYAMTRVRKHLPEYEASQVLHQRISAEDTNAAAPPVTGIQKGHVGMNPGEKPELLKPLLDRTTAQAAMGDDGGTYQWREGTYFMGSPAHVEEVSKQISVVLELTAASTNRTAKVRERGAQLVNAMRAICGYAAEHPFDDASLAKRLFAKGGQAYSRYASILSDLSSATDELLRCADTRPDWFGAPERAEPPGDRLFVGSLGKATLEYYLCYVHACVSAFKRRLEQEGML
ncbi:hypothetical protein FACS189449_00510 [Alphaproteobacteria bacterium]|nr:hypothetical protein FACS189449_00510 [Alphaproteobacteria bacterium]